MHKNIFSFVILVSGLSGYAQTVVKGNITDSAGHPLYPATLSVYRLPDSALLKQAVSDRNGFAISLPAGDFSIVTSFVGYKTARTHIHVSGNDPVLSLGTVRLATSDGNLEEVVVQAAVPSVIVKGDTVVYNAGAYKTPPNATVEDLLKRLPGAEVDGDGNIWVQGKKVNKLYIDGKEFFLGDPKIATRNLSADMIGSIEAFDATSDQSRFTGIKEPNGSKAINLRLKEDRKNALFGKAYAGYGENGSYSAGGTATLLRGDRMFFVGHNSNNINNLFMGNGDKGIQTAPPGRQTSNYQALNYRDNWNKHINGAINYSGTETHTAQLQSSSRQTFLSDSMLIQNSRANSSARSNDQRLNAKINFAIDTFNSIIYTHSFDLQHTGSSENDSSAISVQKHMDGYKINTGATKNASDGNVYTLINTLAWEHRFAKKRKLFYGSFTEGHSTTDQRSSLSSRVNYFDSSGAALPHTLIDQRARQYTSVNNYDLNLAYTEPLTKNHILDFNYAFTTNKTGSSKNSFDLDSLTGEYNNPDTLTTDHFNTTNFYHEASVGLNGKGHSLNYRLGIAARFSGLENINFTKGARLGQHFFNLFPKALLSYSTSKATITGIYKANSTSPTVDQLRPLPDLTNPFLVKVGNPSLKQQFDHSLAISYSYFNKVNFSSLGLMAEADYIVNKISPSDITLSSGIQQVQYINVSGAWNANLSGIYSLPISHNRHGKVQLSVNLQCARDISMVNGMENIRNGFTGTGNLNYYYNLGESLFIMGLAKLAYTATSYSISGNQGIRQLNQEYGINCVYALPWQFHICVDYSLRVTGSQGSLPGKQISVTNATLYKNLFTSHAGEIRLAIFDAFNSASSFAETNGANFIATSATNTLGRTLLLSFIYHFRHSYKSPGIPH